MSEWLSLGFIAHPSEIQTLRPGARNEMTKNQNEKFCELLAEFDTAMLVSESEEHFAGRPMAIAKIEDNGDLWFMSSTNTEKVDEISSHSRVLVTCQRDHGCYLSLSGMASVNHDRKMIEELWKEGFRVWFPGGKDDPSLALIHVHAKHGEYWDNRGSNKLHYLFQAAGAYLTGTKPNIVEGEQHGQVKL